MNLENKIYKLLKAEKSIFLVGKPDAGKSYFVKNELLPYLKSKKMAIKYIADVDSVKEDDGRFDALIIDEVETLQDKEYLQNKYPDENPYYSEKYIKKVASWFDVLSNISSPCVYIITRDNKEDVNKLINTAEQADWDKREVVCFEYKKI